MYNSNNINHLRQCRLWSEFDFQEDIISKKQIWLNNSLTKIGGKLINSQEFLLPIENSKRSLLVITKENPTSKKYPRHPKDIKINPL